MFTILGAGGVIANELVKELSNKGKKIRLVSRTPNKLPGAMEMFPAEVSGKKIQFVTKSDGYIDEFKSMKACKHFIIGNSSYSAMAAILAEAPDKKVIAPAPWFGPKYTDITGDDIYCPDWTVINYEKKEVMA